MRSAGIWAGLAVAAALALSGCTSGGVGQGGVSNTANAFSMGKQVSGHSGTDSYTWQNTMGKAMVSFGGQAAAGTMKVLLKDAAGKQMFSQTFSGASQGGGSTTTAAGTPGAWTIDITFAGFTGQTGLTITGTS